MEEIYLSILETCDRMIKTANEDNDYDSEEELNNMKLEFEELIGEEAVIKFDEYIDCSYEHEADKDFLRVQLAYMLGFSNGEKTMRQKLETELRKEIEEKIRKEYEDKK